MNNCSTRNMTGAFSSAFNLTTLFLALKFYNNLGSLFGFAGVYW